MRFSKKEGAPANTCIQKMNVVENVEIVSKRGGKREGAGRPKKPYCEKLGQIRRDAERRKRKREQLEELQSANELALKKTKTLQKALLEKEQALFQLQRQLFLANNKDEYEDANEDKQHEDGKELTREERLENDLSTKTLGELRILYPQHRITPARQRIPIDKFKPSWKNK